MKDSRGAAPLLRVQELKLSVHHAPEAIEKKLRSILKLKPRERMDYRIVRRSVDARNKADILYVYVLDVSVDFPETVLRRAKDRHIAKRIPEVIVPPERGSVPLFHRPVIIGTGPAGLFAGLTLAENGYRPILLERGEPANKRQETVKRFWETGILDPESNVSFGEGGAGTFSDGKLNTLVKDERGLSQRVLSAFVRHGADPEILYLQKPHVGTDRLIGIVGSMRREIERLGGEVRFGVRMEHLILENGVLKGVRTSGGEIIETEALILATGHSARDTFQNLYADGVPMEAKSFAVGLRVQHPQRMVDVSQYGEKEAEFLSPAPYRLSHQCGDGRGVYSFCMCPGGYVVNASTEQGMTAVNGMSYHDRGSENANAAVIVTVTPEDFRLYGEADPSWAPGNVPEGKGNNGQAGPGVLSGLVFQRVLERAAYERGNGKIPVQLYGDFREGAISRDWGEVSPCFRGQTEFAPLHEVLPEPLRQAFTEGMEAFGRKLSGYSRPDAILAGVESRTSSPVRIPRGSDLMCHAVSGLYPCGEGAGYAGGITSAAMDGIRTAEALIRRFSPV